MSEHQSIEDVLGSYFRSQRWSSMGSLALARELSDFLAAADLPLVDQERGIAVIRLDPELAESVRRHCMRQVGCAVNHDHGHQCRRYCGECAPCRAARIIGGQSE